MPAGEEPDRQAVNEVALTDDHPAHFSLQRRHPDRALFRGVVNLAHIRIPTTGRKLTVELCYRTRRDVHGHSL